jgi:hypothetical protein
MTWGGDQDVRTVDCLMGPKAEGTLALEIRDQIPHMHLR